MASWLHWQSYSAASRHRNLPPSTLGLRLLNHQKDSSFERQSSLVGPPEEVLQCQHNIAEGKSLAAGQRVDPILCTKGGWNEGWLERTEHP